MKRFLTLVLLVLCILTACGGGIPGWGRLSRLGRTVGLDLSGGTLARYEDSHGGFHGDGETFAQVDVEIPAEELAAAPGWKPLPMTENVARAVGLRGAEGVTAGTFSEIGEGFYYFYDRHSQSGDPYDDTGLHDRAFWNFTVAAYDSGRGRLYVYELDT